MRRNHRPPSPPEPACTVLLYPFLNRVGKIRHVAATLLKRTSPRDAAQYQNRVSEALALQAERAGIPSTEVDEHLQLFWSAVQRETGRILEAQYSEGESA